MRLAAGLLVLLLATLAAPADLTAQDTLPLAPGIRVRVSAPDLLGPRAQVAQFAALRGDTLVLRSRGADPFTWTLPLQQVKQLEVSRGRSGSRIAGGAILGVLGGAVLAGGIGYFATRDEGEYSGIGVLLAAPGALIGGVIGGLIGAGTRWERVPLPRRTSIAPHRGSGPRLSVSAPFQTMPLHMRAEWNDQLVEKRGPF